MYAADGISGSVTSNCSAVIAARARLLKTYSVRTGYVFYGTLVYKSANAQSMPELPRLTIHNPKSCPTPLLKQYPHYSGGSN